MTILPDNVTYGYVTGRFVVDGPDGADVIAAGKVRFLPAPRRLRNLGSDPYTVIDLDPLIYDLDIDGDLADADGNKSVALIATDNPEIGPADWTWGVTISLQGQAVTTFDIAVPAGATVDLATVVPTAMSVGVMPTTVVVSGGGSGGTTGDVWLHWEGTQAQYDALGVWDDDTLYAIFADDVGPATTVPGPPLNVTALAGDTSVTVNWQAPAVGSPPTDYLVQRSTVSSSGFTTIATLPATTLSYLSTPLTNGTTYYFQVIATNSVGAGAASTVVSVVPVGTAPTVPGVPTNTVAIAGPGTVTVNWLAPTSNGNSPITAYTVQRSTSATTGFATVQTVSGSTFSHLSTGLTNGTTYYFRVYATNAVGDGATTAVVNAIPTAGATVPGAPLSVVATPSDLAVTVTWAVPASNGGSAITSYNVERSTLPASGFVTIGTVTASSAHSFLSTGLTGGTTYYFRVTALNGIGTGPASTIVNAVPTTPAGPPPSAWADAIATNNLTTITSWYDANTGYDSEGFTSGSLWGPGQTDEVTVNAAWLTANAGANVVLSAGRWTITGLHAQQIIVAHDDITFSHCYADRPGTMNLYGVYVVDGFSGIIVDHCTLNGNFGTGDPAGFGDAINYYNTADHSADGMIVRYTEATAYRAGFLSFFGTTIEYCWVHDLYIFADSHNTSASIRGDNTTFYRNLLTDGNSSAVSLYADSTPFTEFEVNENILLTSNADYCVNFPSRPPNNWNLLSNGYRRELNGNIMVPALVGLASDMAYFTQSHGNRLLDGTPILMDDGQPAVTGVPRLLKLRYNELGGGFLDSQQTYEFVPTPNSTLFVFAAVQNAAHTSTQDPTVTAVGQYPQVFSKILESSLEPHAAGTIYGMKLWLYKAVTGSTTSFQHIVVDPYPTTAAAWFTFWVFEVPNDTGLTLVHSSVATSHGAIDTITSGALSGAATSGNLCIAFAAASAEVAPASSLPFGDVTGWTKIGVQSTTFTAGSPMVTGATYWRNNFTGTTMTIGDLGVGAAVAGVLLTEFS
jgi:hypothetical protein